jgi:hypothetical protein
MGTACLMVSTALLLIIVRPVQIDNLDLEDWTRWATLEPDALAEHMRTDLRAKRVAALARLVRDKFRRLEYGVNFIMAGLGLLASAAVLASHLWGRGLGISEHDASSALRGFAPFKHDVAVLQQVMLGMDEARTDDAMLVASELIATELVHDRSLGHRRLRPQRVTPPNHHLRPRRRSAFRLHTRTR